WDAHRQLPAEERWAELVLAWARGHHLAAVVGTPDSSGTGRSLLSDLTRRDGVRTRRGSLLRVLRTSPTLEATEESLAAALAGPLPLLGLELVLALAEEITSADERLASVLREAAPPPVEEVLLDADLTVVIPGRPAESLLPLLDWTEPVSRGGALTLRFTTASVRRALGDGRDADALLALLE